MTTDQPSAVPLPPADATTHTTCCEYCPVACGYKVYTWPLGRQGGTLADENALGVDFPATALSGRWISENMHNVVRVDGELQNVVILPDPDADVVNTGGTHSTRGGQLAQKCYSETGRTSDRLQQPLLRVNGTLVPIPWNVATDLVAELSSHTIAEHGELAWGMKIYSYEFYENVFAASKLALGEIATPNYSPHHAPAEGDDVPGLSDCGIDAFSAAFVDDEAADVLFIAGSDPYETKSVRFTTWQQAGGATIIYVDPRKTFTASYAENNGGLHLQLAPGTDTALYMAICRVIVENGWWDEEFVDAYVATRSELDAEGNWRRVEFGRSFDELREWLTSTDDFSLAGAEQVTGVPAEKIQQAAEMLTGAGGPRPKATVLFEKGVYWSHNYENTAAIGDLGVLIGSAGREGRAISRMGGHQRGGQKAAGYPIDKSPHEYEGHKVEMDTERWLVQGNTRFRWIVGTNWLGAMGATDALRNAVVELKSVGPEVTSTRYETALQQLKDRIDAGGLVIVHQEIYENDSTPYADIILPAATWGEEDFARNNAERRLRIYERFMDPPGEARPDWQIFAEVARKMGFEGFEWTDSNAIFEEAAANSAGGRRDYAALVEKARADGVRGHDLLRTFGTTGLQTPLGLENGELTQTVRLHEDLTFKSDSGKCNFVLADWDAVKERNAMIGPAPSKDEVWVLNGRVNALWNNLFDYVRRQNAMERWPSNFLEINPDDAAERGIVNGDLLSIESDNVLDQLGRVTTGGFTAVAYVSDIVPPGVTFTYFLYPGSPANNVTSADSSLQPLNLRYNFKLGKGSISNLGPSGLADTMSFSPRNLAPGGPGG
ncbi:MAG: arsenate reductase (azurin) large subunit [Acidimicrobiia bacterium]|nr:arsenate reductase (azurin) large subunit [Acidimicrobiia bacterium]